jgi:hypothetical protein
MNPDKYPSRLPMNSCALAPDLYIFIWILANLSKLKSAWVRGCTATEIDEKKQF